MRLASAISMTSTANRISPFRAAPGASSVAPRMADDDRKRKGEPGGPGTAVITKTKPQTKRPNMYRVLILNDDYTPMEFVVHVLERFFSKDHEAATRIMLHVHHHGIGECGIYTYEVAETKVTQVMDFARNLPLNAMQVSIAGYPAVLSDPLGRYVLTGLPAGTYTVTINEVGGDVRYTTRSVSAISS